MRRHHLQSSLPHPSRSDAPRRCVYAQFWVSNPERLAVELIPVHYDHSSFASWMRALHAHNFKKTAGPAQQRQIWGHPDFHRDDPTKAALITRKRPQRRLLPERPPTPVDAFEQQLRLNSPAHSDDASSGTGTDSTQQPSPEVASRLDNLRAQLSYERKCMTQLKGMLERLEADATRQRREELRERALAYQLACCLARVAAPGLGEKTVPALAAAKSPILNVATLSSSKSKSSAVDVCEIKPMSCSPLRERPVAASPLVPPVLVTA